MKKPETKIQRSRVYYGVKINADDGREFFAHGNDSPVSLHYKYPDASKFKRALKEHGMNAKVIKIRATFEEL